MIGDQTSIRLYNYDYRFVVDLNVTYPYCDSLIEFCCDFMINLGDCSWHNSSVFVFSAATSHGESFSSTSLPIAHNGAIVPLNY